MVNLAEISWSTSIQSATDALRTAPKRVIQKAAEVTGYK